MNDEIWASSVRDAIPRCTHAIALFSRRKQILTKAARRLGHILPAARRREDVAPPPARAPHCNGTIAAPG
ncbi:hypothetical protein AAB992_35540 [Burkholderia contaminans]|uniref:hypothetical protein n=1 Tax=Burkholderia contaminans TaxID=488447 RepID=UPI002416E3A9|nr:hypothetical protein [Burkholderia contaminans]WFN13016.1 hypothetical protein LXE92_18720 [Burkholderia contaminans]